MDYYDLNLSNPQLAAEELKLGFKIVKTAKVINLQSGKDFSPVNSKELISVEGAGSELLRNCIKQRKPILCSPLKTQNYYKDVGLIREAIERETVFEIPISDFLRVNFVYRAKLINNTRNFLKRCIKLNAPYIFTSRASTSSELKTPQEIIAILITLFDLTPQQAQYSISKRAEAILNAVSR